MELKSKHEQILDIVDEVSSTVSKLGIAYCTTEDYELDGRIVHINGQELLSFGSCSYLGLELDPRLKAGAIDAVQRYGTQFSSSRSYLSVSLYSEIENLLGQMFNQPIVLAPTTTLGHLSNIPVLIGDNDAVILDSQVHECVQTSVQLLKTRNVTVELIRHNRLDMLEERIKTLSETHKKIWYMADGVYSMYGDFPPIKELVQLMNKYEQFYLYVDDAHGMSWTGKNGTGYVMSQLTTYPEKLYLVCGLAKAFGSAGGVLVFPDEASRNKVRHCGKTMIFSGPIQPAVLGASISSAKIHLSGEITKLQNDLLKRMEFFNKTARALGLPLITETNSPIFFIGVGKPDVGYNMIKRMMQLGFYFNLSVFPSVSYKNTGLRIPLTLHHTFADIENLLKAIAEQLPYALNDSHSNMNEIYKSFKLVA